ncbi:cellulose 1,4-beta-cellobiosidase [Streptomyces fagopyri]|uniref:Cellulose 1,4-beta-cellobiosidase n=1 Tax=Streptomyces fagopyri TaxID=2662397 RepID=A0A5Q0L4N4_9ACTN|nr:cellulose 1,4-beta-cellobiosidase [Streptomyces fagopyri]
MNATRRCTSTASATAVVLATAGGLLTVAAVPASAATTCTSPVYKRQFFANTAFSGTPKRTDCDSAVDEKWGANAPASGLPTNNFAVRWSVTRDFGSGGPFALSVAVQDGIRVYVDNSRKVDLWKNGSTTTKKTVNVTIPTGRHTLRVDYVNWTGSANVQFGYTPNTSATADKVKPLTPTGASASYDKTTGKAKLGWAKNNEMDLAGYRVYRRLKGAAFGSTPLATTTSTSYTDTPPASGEVYYYEVRAYDRAGNASAGSTDQAVVSADRTAPAVPTGLSATGESTGLRVGWSAVEGAASYRVYRAATAQGTYTLVGSTGKVSYVDTSAAQDVSYSYRVTALDAAGNESARSVPLSGTRRDLTPPSAVTGVTVVPTEYGFAVSWDANPTPDLARYVVRRGELWGDDDEKVCSLYPGYYVSADTTSYAYTTVPDGDESCFIVDAIDDAGNSAFQWTGEAQIVTATELDMTPSVATPEGSPLRLEVSAAAGTEGNRLTWSGLGASEEGPSAPALGFRIYRWNPATADYEKIDEAPAGAFEYFDTGARRGTTSYYWVTGVMSDGTETLPAGDMAVTAPTA